MCRASHETLWTALWGAKICSRRQMRNVVNPFVAAWPQNRQRTRNHLVYESRESERETEWVKWMYVLLQTLYIHIHTRNEHICSYTCVNLTTITSERIPTFHVLRLCYCKNNDFCMLYECVCGCECVYGCKDSSCVIRMLLLFYEVSGNKSSFVVLFKLTEDIWHLILRATGAGAKELRQSCGRFGNKCLGKSVT